MSKYGKYLGEKHFGIGQEVKLTYQGKPILKLRDVGSMSQIATTNEGIIHVPKKDLKLLKDKLKKECGHWK